MVLRYNWVLLVLLLYVFACGGDADRPIPASVVTFAPAAMPELTPLPSPAPPPVVSVECDARSAMAKVLPSVVSVRVHGVHPEEAEGIIVAPEGQVLTTSRIFPLKSGMGSTTVEVVLHDGRRYSASLRGTDSDFALVEVAAPSPLPAVVWADEGPAVGSRVIALSYPEASSWSEVVVTESFTEGGLRALWVESHGFVGPSGSPLVNLCGQVVAIRLGRGWRDEDTKARGGIISLADAKAAVARLLAPRPPSRLPELGAWVRIIGTGSCLNIRAAPGLAAFVNSCEPDGSIGQITKGPVEKDSHRWYRIVGWGPQGGLAKPLILEGELDGIVKGWAAEEFLRFVGEGTLEFKNVRVGDRQGSFTVEAISGYGMLKPPSDDRTTSFSVLFSGQAVVEGRAVNTQMCGLAFAVSEESRARLPNVNGFVPHEFTLGGDLRALIPETSLGQLPNGTIVQATIVIANPVVQAVAKGCGGIGAATLVRVIRKD